jgi:hypothetical protein
MIEIRFWRMEAVGGQCSEPRFGGIKGIDGRGAFIVYGLLFMVVVGEAE